jgi:hypothetical protein
LEQRRESGRLLTRDLLKERLIAHLPDRMRQIERGVASADPELRERYRAVRRLTLLGAVSSWLGMWFELLKPAKGKWLILRGRPVTRLTVVSPSGARLTTVDLAGRAVLTTDLPLDLPLRLADGSRVPLRDALRADRRPAEWRDLLAYALDRDLDDAVIVKEEPDLRSPAMASTLPPDRLRRLVDRVRRFSLRHEPFTPSAVRPAALINNQSGKTFWP